MSNHLGDTNKMVSDTPRTDEAQFGTGRVSVSFARQLEHELNDAKDRIKLLEDALVSMGKYWNRDTKVQVMEAKL